MSRPCTTRTSQAALNEKNQIYWTNKNKNTREDEIYTLKSQQGLKRPHQLACTKKDKRYMKGW